MASVDNRQVLTGLGTLGSGVLSGLYFIFSFCVMDALNQQGPANAIANICVDLPPSMQQSHG